MSTPQQVTFTLQEMVKMILRAQGIREGYWELTVETRVTPMGVAVGEEGPLPSVIVQFSKCGIVRTPEPTACSVDASLLEWPETINAERRIDISAMPEQNRMLGY